MTHSDSSPTPAPTPEWTEYIPEGSQAGAPARLAWRWGARVIDLGIWIAVLVALRSLPLAPLWYALWTLCWLVLPLLRGGATAGKYLCGIRMVRADGGPVTLGRAALRETFVFASLAIPVIGVLGVLASLNDRRRQGLHDKVFDTLVVKR